MDPQELTLFWVFIAIFSITAIVTLLGITGVIKTIKERYLNALFGALILEVVAAVVLLFQQVSFEPAEDGGPGLEAVVERAGLVDLLPDGEDLDDFLVDRLRLGDEQGDLQVLCDSLRQEVLNAQGSLAEKEQQIERLEADFGRINQKFYAKISRLHDLIPTFGRTINLAWGLENGRKDEVFRLLIDVFGELGMIRDQQNLRRADGGIHYAAVRDVYLRYRKKWNFPPFEDAGVYLDEADVVHFLQTYLKVDE